jgi:hypothetical protein
MTQEKFSFLFFWRQCSSTRKAFVTAMKNWKQTFPSETLRVSFRLLIKNQCAGKKLKKTKTIMKIARLFFVLTSNLNGNCLNFYWCFGTQQKSWCKLSVSLGDILFSNVDDKDVHKKTRPNLCLFFFWMWKLLTSKSNSL